MMKNHENEGIFMIFRIFGETFTAPTGSTEAVARCHLHSLGMRYDKNIKPRKNPKNFFFDEKKKSKKNRNQKFSKKNHFFFDRFLVNKKVIFLLKKFDFQKFSKIDFFSKKKSHRKKSFFDFVFSFYFFIVYQVQPVLAASRNSPCTARGRGKRTPKIRKIPKIVNLDQISSILVKGEAIF